MLQPNSNPMSLLWAARLLKALAQVCAFVCLCVCVCVSVCVVFVLCVLGFAETAYKSIYI